MYGEWAGGVSGSKGHGESGSLPLTADLCWGWKKRRGLVIEALGEGAMMAG